MRTIVSIISEQTIPNYLFIKEMFQPGDQLMFVSSKKMSNRIAWIENALNWSAITPQHVVLEKDGDEENWGTMTAQIEKVLSKEDEYIVNLTGGTKYMALAVHSLFEKYHSDFFYIPYPQNQILAITNNKTMPVQYRVGVEEYIHLCGQNVRGHNVISQSPIYTKTFLERFLNKMNASLYPIIDGLRAYRDSKKGIDAEFVEQKVDEKNKPQVPKLRSFLRTVEFPSQTHLTRHDVQYLTGGWFEEFVYNYIVERLHPNDILLGVKIESTNNDLDVVFTLGNKLYVVECKTGVERKGVLNEIVYKASALKSSLFALSAKSYIFALSEDNPDWEMAAKNMNITYCGRSHFTNLVKLDDLLNQIKKMSNN